MAYQFQPRAGEDGTRRFGKFSAGLFMEHLQVGGPPPLLISGVPNFPSPPYRITFRKGALLWLTASTLMGRRWSSTETFPTTQSF